MKIRIMKTTKIVLSILLAGVLTSCGGVSDNIYILADTSTPDESVEEEFCKRTGIDNSPITNLDEEEK